MEDTKVLENLLNVKEGKSKIIRLIVKVIFWIFIIGAFLSIIYSLNEIQKTNKQLLNIQLQKTSFEITKIQRSCEFTARNELNIVLANAKKNKQEIKKEDQEKFLNNAYNNCLFLNGINIVAPQQNQAAASQQAPVKDNTKKTETKK